MRNDRSQSRSCSNRSTWLSKIQTFTFAFVQGDESAACTLHVNVFPSSPREIRNGQVRIAELDDFLLVEWYMYM
jgi:hypothetical protein